MPKANPKKQRMTKKGMKTLKAAKETANKRAQKAKASRPKSSKGVSNAKKQLKGRQSRIERELKKAGA